MDWKRAARILFAATMLAIGIMGLVGGSFAPIWAVVPKTLPDRQLLAYLFTFMSLLCGAGLLVERTAAPAALVLLIYLLIWTAPFSRHRWKRFPTRPVARIWSSSRLSGCFSFNPHTLGRVFLGSWAAMWPGA